MTRIRRKHSAEFKLKAVIEILKGEKTASQLAGESGVHLLILSGWKKQFLEMGSQIFEKPRKTLKIMRNLKKKPSYLSRLAG
jgi:transposase-like protein